MTPERWQEIKKLLAAALERETARAVSLSGSGLRRAIAAG